MKIQDASFLKQTLQKYFGKVNSGAANTALTEEKNPQQNNPYPLSSWPYF